jgi:hypothetical protein
MFHSRETFTGLGFNRWLVISSLVDHALNTTLGIVKGQELIRVEIPHPP